MTDTSLVRMEGASFAKDLLYHHITPVSGSDASCSKSLTVEYLPLQSKNHLVANIITIAYYDVISGLCCANTILMLNVFIKFESADRKISISHCSNYVGN